MAAKFRIKQFGPGASQFVPQKLVFGMFWVDMHSACTQDTAKTTIVSQESLEAEKEAKKKEMLQYPKYIVMSNTDISTAVSNVSPTSK